MRGILIVNSLCGLSVKLKILASWFGDSLVSIYLEKCMLGLMVTLWVLLIHGELR